MRLRRCRCWRCALDRRRRAAVLLLAVARSRQAPRSAARADKLVDESVRAAMLKRPDGRIAHIESEYNDIFVTKRRDELTMSFQLKGWDYTEVGHQSARSRTICRCATRR